MHHFLYRNVLPLRYSLRIIIIKLGGSTNWLTIMLIVTAAFFIARFYAYLIKALYPVMMARATNLREKLEHMLLSPSKQSSNASGGFELVSPDERSQNSSPSLSRKEGEENDSSKQHTDSQLSRTNSSPIKENSQILVSNSSEKSSSPEEKNEEEESRSILELKDAIGDDSMGQEA